MRLFKYKTEKEQLKAVREDGYNIMYIHNPSEKVQLEAVENVGDAIQYLYNPSEDVQLEAVKQNGNAIQYIHNPSEKVIRYLIDNSVSDKDVMRLLFAKIGKDGYDKLPDEDKLKIELGD